MTRDLGPMIDDARDEVHDQLDAGGRVRDFAAMIARARALDPSAVSDAALAESAGYAPVVVLHRPAPAPVRPAPSPWRGRVVWLGLAVAAAAALLLDLVGSARLAHESVATRAGSTAQHLGPPLTHTAAVLTPPPRAPSAAAPADLAAQWMPEETAPDLAPPAVVRAEPEPTAAAPAPPARRVRPGPPPVADAPPPAAAPTGAELDRLAREAWRRGDLGEARRIFTMLVATDTDPQRLELAFGDLFVLARQSGEDSKSLERTRRAYLERFPRGLYADDASAALCRAARGLECWRRYRDEWPAGAHLEEARRLLGESSAAP